NNARRSGSTRITNPVGLPLWTSRARLHDESTPWLLLALLTVLAVVLRSIGLDSGLWYDEIKTLLESVHSPLLRILTVFPGDNQHTLFSVLAHLSISVFGDHPWSLRLPSMLLGAATVPVLFFFAREFVGRTEALLTSLLLAVSYHHVWFSQSARGYATLAFLAVLSSWLLLRGLRRGHTSDFVLYGVAAALGVYTHITMVFLVASHALLCVIPLGLPGFSGEALRRWRLPLFGFLLAGVFTLVLYSPVLFEVRHTLEKKADPMKGATAKWAFVELIRGMQIGLGSAAAVLVGAAVFLIGTWSYFKQSKFVLGMFVLPGIITIAAPVVLHRPVRPRFILFLIGFALLIAVRGALEVGRMLQRRRSSGTVATSPVGIGLVLVLSVLSAASLRVNYEYPKQDFVGARQFVHLHRGEGEPVLTAGPAIYPYRAYFAESWQGITSLAEFQAARARGRRVWVIYTLDSYIRTDTPNLMAALRADCAVQSVFRGTLGGGDVTVCLAAPLPAAK
ncbi:MAG: glycosyltransferase family 39 protein, partial [bacterium]